MAESGSRRHFLKTGLLIAGGAGLGFVALSRFLKSTWKLRSNEALGSLKPVIDETTGLPILLLPEGFRYRTFAWAGETLADGHVSQTNCDGMGVVSTFGSRVTLVRNHEISGSEGPFGNPEMAWDVTGGGTTTLVWDSDKEQLVDSRVSLSGTLVNCAGGVTPWGTWLSCEEAPYTPALAHLGIESRQMLWRHEKARQRHGYVFEVHPEGEKAPQPIEAMGQFYHEAVAIDPQTGIAYMTEDRAPHAGFYRFVPDQAGRLGLGGRLQMMKVSGFDYIHKAVPGGEVDVSWVDIVEPDRGHSPGTHDGQGVVEQGRHAGATAFIALEGCLCKDGQVWFTSKAGGQAGVGQIFCFDTVAQTLQLVFEVREQNGFSGPDNIVFSPRGSLVICEDRVSRSTRAQHLAGLTAGGELFAFAQINPALSGSWQDHELAATVVNSEWAGVCFSDDGQWLFANIYSPGVTVAITGPWVDGLI